MEENVRDVKLLTERVSVKQGSLPGAGGGGEAAATECNLQCSLSYKLLIF